MVFGEGVFGAQVIGSTGDACPCGGGRFATCCRPWLDGTPAPTAEALMRSRYTAYTRGDVDHLLRTWHPRTRPESLPLDPGREWTGLRVLAHEAGGEGDEHGVVTYQATCRREGRREVLAESARFARRAGRWCYVDGEVGPLASS